MLERILDERLGLRLDGHSEAVIRMTLAELPSPLSPDSPAVLQRLLTAFGVGETSFLRHPEHFRALVELLGTLPSVDAARPVAAWSAGCATGEEAYSLAAVLRDAGARYCVRGSDANCASIGRGRAGLYRLWSLRGVTLDETESFLSVTPLEVEVRPELRRTVELDVRNLLVDAYPTDLDVVFCRNVLLYFRPEAARRVYERIACSLAPGGVLFIGYADPEPEVPSLVPCRVSGVRYFRRSSGSRATSRTSLSPPPAPAASRRRPTPAPITRRDDALCFARALAAEREFDRALAVLREIGLSDDETLVIEAQVLTAMIAEEAGLPSLAVDAARRAYFLAPEEPITLYLLGAALDRVGATELSTRRLEQARAFLARERDDSAALRFGEGLTVNQLRRMIGALLDRL